MEPTVRVEWGVRVTGGSGFPESRVLTQDGLTEDDARKWAADAPAGSTAVVVRRESEWQTVVVRQETRTHTTDWIQA